MEEVQVIINLKDLCEMKQRADLYTYISNQKEEMLREIHELKEKLKKYENS